MFDLVLLLACYFFFKESSIICTGMGHNWQMICYYCFFADATFVYLSYFGFGSVGLELVKEVVIKQRLHVG